MSEYVTLLEYVTFQSPCGRLTTISHNDMRKYPESFLTTMIGDLGITSTCKIHICYEDMQLIAHFYEEGYWKHPHKLENRLKMDFVDGDFYAKCFYLGLLTDINDDDISSDSEDDHFSEEFSSDFDPYRDPSMDDDDDYRDYYC